MTAELQKRFLSMRDQRAVFEIMFTDEEDAADFIEKQLGLWDLSGMAQGIVDGVVGLMGLIDLDLPRRDHGGGDERARRSSSPRWPSPSNSSGTPMGCPPR